MKMSGAAGDASHSHPDTPSLFLITWGKEKKKQKRRKRRRRRRMWQRCCERLVGDEKERTHFLFAYMTHSQSLQDVLIKKADSNVITSSLNLSYILLLLR